MIACVVPARIESSRLPGKVLLDATGRPLIAHTIEAAKACPRFDVVAVATDSVDVGNAAWEASADLVRLVDGDYPTGTDRVAAAVQADDDLADAEIVVNLQADEPEVSPEALSALVGCIEGGAEMATIADRRELDHAILPTDRNTVLVDLRPEGDARWFHRYDGLLFGSSRLHIGAYAFTRDALLRFAFLPRSEWEVIYSLEQLRWLDHGGTIAVALVDHTGAGINTPADYDAFVARYRSRCTTS